MSYPSARVRLAVPLAGSAEDALLEAQIGRCALEWKTLLCPTRVRDAFLSTEARRDPVETRSEFEKDYDRAVFSTPLRRMQDKTQVFPLEPNDFVRTRLTHSIEVSTLARGLVRRVTIELEKRKSINAEQARDIEAIAATCGLIHDLGNPPFGHAGELAIREWFKALKTADDAKEPKDRLLVRLTPQQVGDFAQFDGNAQTLRLVSRLQVLADEYGLNLTLGTLSAAMKYTAASYETVPEEAHIHEREKPGYFASESDLVQYIRKYTGTGGARNPITFLTEAVDDLAYATVDFEDGLKKGLSTWDDAKGALLKEAEKQKCEETLAKRLAEAEKYLDDRSTWPQSGRARGESMAQMVRTRVIGQAMADVAQAFLDRYDKILAGDYHGELIADSASAGIIKTFKKVDRKLFYPAEANLRLELMGQKVISDLLSAFFEGAKAFNGDPTPDTREFPGKLYHLMSTNYRNVFEKAAKEAPTTVYPKLQLVTDYVCGMTDSFACSLHQQLTHG